jgi:anti-sigma regulatory factor (Ser/Thr protein kinase)
MSTVVEHNDADLAIGDLRLPARPAKLRDAREYAHRAAAAFGLDTDHCHEFAFAVNEAVTNAIRHGRPDAHGDIHLSVHTDDGRLTLSVRDYGTFSGYAPVGAMDADRGRGFVLMVRVMDAVQLCIGSGSTTVRLSKVRM